MAHASEQMGISKAKAAIYMGVLAILVGLGSLFSLEFMDFVDTTLTASYLLPFAALVAVLFVGWRLDRTIVEGELSDEDRKLGHVLLALVRYVAPAMISVIFIAGIIN